MKCLILYLVLTILSNPFNNNGFAKGKPFNKDNVKKTADDQVSVSFLDINNIKTNLTNVGFCDYFFSSTTGGFEFPKGSYKTAVFTSGLLWGGFVQGDSQVRIGGTNYYTGLRPGPILSNGQAATNPYTDSKWRIYRVRKDIYQGGPTVDLSSEAQLEDTSREALRIQYEKDWSEWPAAGTSNDLGAPFVDVNKNGIYEPSIDIPGVYGADQTIYFVANDQDSTLTKGLYGTLPLGIELHATFWAYAQTGAIGNMYFKKYTLINKGYQHNSIDSMFISYWADPDVGDLENDFFGSDSSINMMYAYNGYPSDDIYSPDIPPCIGFSLLQGPIVNGSLSDTAIFNGQKILGKKNLPMTASYSFITGNSDFNFPPNGQKTGATQFYNFFNGRYGESGIPMVDPQNHITKFVFPGDPVIGSGWTENQSYSPLDVAGGIASGPFNFAPGDTQEVVFSEMIGEGSDYLHSIHTVTKYLYYYAHDVYKNIINNAESSTPPIPVFSISNINDTVKIQWDNRAENFNKSGYAFEGYNIYQLAEPYGTKQSAKLIGTFDKVDGITTLYGFGIDGPEIQQLGTDSGIQYNFIPVKDYINNAPFIKGKNYYYAVTSYTYNSGNVFQNNTESILKSKTVSYNHNLPGANYNDTLSVIHISGNSSGSIIVGVADPSKLTGHNYKIFFTQDGDSVRWNLSDNTNGSDLLSGRSIWDSHINIDGLFIDLLNPLPGINSWSDDPDSLRWFTGFGSFLYFYGGLDAGINFFFGSDITNYIPVALKFVAGPNSPSINAGWSKGAVYRRDLNYEYQGIGWLPVTAWDISIPDNPQQINLSFVEDANFGNTNKQWDLGWDGNYFSVMGGREYLLVNNTPYDSNQYNATVEGLSSDVLYALWPDGRPGYTYLQGAFNFYIYPNVSFMVNDEFSFTSPSPLTGIKSANIVNQYLLSQNYPNPFNPITTINYSIPKTNIVTIKIYDILGREVETLVNAEKASGNYKVEFNGSKLASGIYFYRMIAGDYTATKKFLLMK